MNRSVRTVMAAVYAQMSARRRKQFYVLLALMLVGAFAELVTIGAILPFLSLLAAPAELDHFPALLRAFEWVGADTQGERFAALGILFSITILIASALRLLLAWVTHAFSFRLGHEIGVELHRRLLYQSYTWHVQRNSSEAIAAHEKVQVLTFNVLLPIMVGGSSLAIAAFIVARLVYIDPFTAVITAISFSLIYTVISLFTRRRLFTNSNIINSAYGQRVQAVQESLGGIRDVILDRSQPLYLAAFQKIDRRLRHAQAINLFIGAAPRYLIEGAGMVIIILVAILLSGRSGGVAGALPVLGALALGAQRLLPLLQHVYYGWVQVRGNWPVAVEVTDLLKLPMPPREVLEGPAPEPLPFERELRFEHVGFRYPGSPEKVLDDVHFTISKGQRIALIGTTGSGKSTLVDLLMGLLEPQEGRVTIDGVPLTGEARRRWSAQIGHVPQSIYLADTTIGRNIAFGSPEEEIDPAGVREAARQAQLADFIETLPEGYETRVGERGVRLSGGQRQRLGIARALYKKAPVLILDEATSALDGETEAAVMGALEGLDEALTVVMIAHRLSTIAGCDLVVRLDGGRIVDIGPYAALVGASGPEAIQRRGSE